MTQPLAVSQLFLSQLFLSQLFLSQLFLSQPFGQRDWFAFVADAGDGCFAFGEYLVIEEYLVGMLYPHPFGSDDRSSQRQQIVVVRWLDVLTPQVDHHQHRARLFELAVANS